MTKTKRCSRCNHEKSLNEFGIARDKKSGRSSQCKTCRHEVYELNKSKKLAYQQEYAKNHSEEIKLYNKKYREKNKEEIRNRNMIKYRLKHPVRIPKSRRKNHLKGETYEGKPCKNGHSGLRYASNSMCVECTHIYVTSDKRKIYSKEYGEKNKQQKRLYHHNRRDVARIYAQDYREKNRDKINAYSAKYRVSDKGKATQSDGQRKHRAAKNGASVCDLTRAQWEAIKAHFEYKCVYCGIEPKRLTQDHVIPLSKGGNHTASNVVPACGPCNSKKGTGDPLIPVQPLQLAG